MSNVRLTVPVLMQLIAGCVVGEDMELGDEDEGDSAVGLQGQSATIKVVQHNIEKKSAPLNKALERAMAIGAQAITLQEVCPDQLAWLHANYGDTWTIGSVPGNKPAITGCDLPDGTHDVPTSVAIWTGGKRGKVTQYQSLSSPANAPGGMVCVEFERAKVPVHLCSAHLIAGDWVDPVTGTAYDGAALRLQQTTKVKQIARTWFEGNRNHFGILGGDFNSTPSAGPLDKLYDNRLGGTGEFTEYNRTGSSRTGTATAHSSGENNESGEPAHRKIDYVFFSTNRAPLNGPAVTVDPDGSDHDMVTSTVQMRK